ncbi:MFS transporter [Rubrobacter marinus]|uniref:MFS transporter n=1 Tax=Rubrobacter marinus TaxID=2653852 RepID=UPI001A9D4CC4|nr:MFS transporter [Rubrobacter marinus]
MQKAIGGRFYYGWAVVAVVFLALLVSAGVRAAPAVLINPLEMELGWSRAAISFAVSIGLLLYGLSGPAAGWLMDRFGPTRVVLFGLVVIGGSTLMGAAMTQLWQLNLFWGALSGIGTGVVAPVLGATVANRWFVERRGLVLGILGAAASAGQLVSVPALMWLVVAVGWREGTVYLAIVTLLILVPVLLFMRDDPSRMGLRPYGEGEKGANAAEESPAPEPGTAVANAEREEGGGVLRRATRAPEFWLLSGSFFICGASSNGIIGVHFVPHSIDHGIPEVTAASVLALMGAMNFVGTIASGWLTDRYDPRTLLAVYYSLRGLSLLLLPFVDAFAGLAIFAIFFGLDYIATVPPTVALVADRFGRAHVGTVFGWVFFAHQIGAALAAYLGGVARDSLGDYTAAFLAAGVLAILAALMASRVSRASLPPAGAGARGAA